MLTIREMFAIAAMNALLTQPEKYSITSDEQLAKRSFDIAEAMMKYQYPNSAPIENPDWERWNG
jgi:hypothetical protein